MVSRCPPTEIIRAGRQSRAPKGGSNRMSILWIILIVILVLALLGFFSRGRW
jgi:flagellar basal body-associated protein FliL